MAGQLKDEAAAAVVDLILGGRLRSHEPLPLPRIAELLGTSVTPAREALLLLAQEGWVTQEPNRGFRVAPMRRGEIADLFLLHRFLSGELAARAAAALDAADAQELAEAGAQIAATPVTSPHRLVALNRRLHQIVEEAAASPHLRHIRGATRLHVRDMASVDGWLEHTRTSHGPLVRALLVRDAEAARVHAAEHYGAGSALILRHWDAVGLWSAEDEPAPRPARLLPDLGPLAL